MSTALPALSGTTARMVLAVGHCCAAAAKDASTIVANTNHKRFMQDLTGTVVPRRIRLPNKGTASVKLTAAEQDRASAGAFAIRCGVAVTGALAHAASRIEPKVPK